VSKWGIVRLGDVTTVVSGTTPKTSVDEYWNGDFQWVTPAEIKDSTRVIVHTERTITSKAIKDSALKAMPIGTVLLSSRAPIGKVAIAGVEMYCNQGFKNLICTDKLQNKFLFWHLKGKTEYLNSKRYQKVLLRKLEFHCLQLKFKCKYLKL
jgi:type I restriction enzyme S subunit